MTSAELRRIVGARSWAKTWFARGQHLSRRPDNTGMGDSLYTNHIGVMADRDDAAAVATIVNHADAIVALVTEVERNADVLHSFTARNGAAYASTASAITAVLEALDRVHAIRSTP